MSCIPIYGTAVDSQRQRQDPVWLTQSTYPGLCSCCSAAKPCLAWASLWVLSLAPPGERKRNTLLKKQSRINQLIKVLNTVGSKDQLVRTLASKPDVPSSIPGTHLVEKRIDT